jgi:hypothetical protein
VWPTDLPQMASQSTLVPCLLQGIIVLQYREGGRKLKQLGLSFLR